MEGDPSPSFTPSQPLFTVPTFLLLPLVCLLDVVLLAGNYPAALLVIVVPCVSAAPPYPPGPRSSLYAPSHYRPIPDQSEVALRLCRFFSRWRPSSVTSKIFASEEAVHPSKEVDQLLWPVHLIKSKLYAIHNKLIQISPLRRKKLRLGDHI